MSKPVQGPGQSPGKGPRIGRSVLGGTAVVAAFFGGFGSWAALAPLESAALAPGMVMVDSNRKTIQHLEGGIVSEILVKEGSEVQAGDPLVLLTSAQAKAARRSRAASVSGSRSRAPCSATRSCWSSTSRTRTSTRPGNAR